MWALFLGVAVAAPGWNPTHEKAIAHFNDGLALLGQAAPEKAEKLFRKAMKIEASGMTEHMLATAILRQNRADEAIVMYAGLAETYPDEPEAWAGYSESLFVGEQFNDARQAALRGVDLEPANYNAQQAALSADLRLGSYDDARARLTQYAADAEPGYPDCLWVTLALEVKEEALARDHFPACEAHTEQSIAEGVRMGLASHGWNWSEAGNSARSIGADRYADLARIMDLLEQGRLEEGLSAANAAIEAHGSSPGIQLLRGIILIQGGNKEAGLTDLEAVLESDDWVDAERGGTVTGVLTASSKTAWDLNVTTAVAYAAAIYEEQGKSEKAQELIARTTAKVGTQAPLQVAQAELTLSRGDASGWQHVTEALPKLGESRNAAAHVGELLFAYPDAPEAVLAWAAAHGDAGVLANALAGSANRGDYDSCLRLVTAKSERDKRTAQDDQLGYVCSVGLKDADRAEIWLAHALKSKSAKSVTVQNHLAFLVNSGNADRARAVLATAGEVLDEPVRHDMAARLLLGTGNGDALLTAVGKPGVTPNVRFNAGVELYNAGRYDDAQPLFEGTCPELTGAAQDSCEQALAAVKTAPRQ